MWYLSIQSHDHNQTVTSPIRTSQSYQSGLRTHKLLEQPQHKANSQVDYDQSGPSCHCHVNSAKFPLPYPGSFDAEVKSKVFRFSLQPSAPQHSDTH
jgi:hypothetical protein